MATLTWDAKKKRWRLNWTDFVNGHRRHREYYLKGQQAVAAERLMVVREYEVRGKRGLKVSSPKSFAEVVLEYVERYLVATTETHQHREILRIKKVINPYFGAMPIGMISEQEIRNYVHSRRDKVSNKTIRNELSTISSVFGFAKDQQMLSDNPVRTLNLRTLLPNRPTRSGKYVTNVELSRFMDSAKSECRKGVILLRETGLRMGELFPQGVAIAIEAFDLERRLLVLRHRKDSPLKGKRDRIIPLTETVMEILSEVESGPILRLKRAGFEDQFYNALKASKVRFSLHDLRHTFTSVLSDSGMSAQRISQITGHSSLFIMTRYVHDVTRDTDTIRDDMERALGRRHGAGFANYLKQHDNNASPRGFEPDSPKNVTHRKIKNRYKTAS